MKRFYLSILAAAFCTGAGAQTAPEPTMAWYKLLGNTGNTGCDHLTVDPNGYMYSRISVSANANLGNGVVLTHSGQGSSPYLAKFAPDGTALWAKKTLFNSVGSTDIMLTDTAGNLYIAASFVAGSLVDTIPFPPLADAFNAYFGLAKFNPNGQIQWLRPMPAVKVPNYSENYFGSQGHISLRFDTQGQLLVTGSMVSEMRFIEGSDTLLLPHSLPFSDSSGVDAFMATYDTDGHLLAARTLGVVNNNRGIFSSGYPERFAQDGEGFLYRLVPYSQTLIKYDPQGNTVAIKTLSAAGGAREFRGISVDADGNVFISGFYLYSALTLEGILLPKLGDVNSADAFLLKLSASDWQAEWISQYPYVHDEQFRYTRTDAAGNIYAAGYYGNIGYVNSFITKYDTWGNLMWAKIIEHGLSPTAPAPDAWVSLFNIAWAADGGNIIVNGTAKSRFKVSDTTTLIFPNITKGLIIQYGICSTPEPVIHVPHALFCAGDSVPLTASGGTGQYLWNTGDTGTTLSASSTRTYSVIAIQDQECYGQSAPVLLTELPPPPVAVSASDTLVCEGTEVALTASGGVTYLWQDGSPGAVYTDTPHAHTQYTVTGTDSNGCSAAATVEVEVNLTPLPSVSLNGYVLSTGNYAAYQWYVNGTSIPGADAQTHTAAENGTYTVEVTDANGCTGVSAPVEVGGLYAAYYALPATAVYPNPACERVYVTGTWEKASVEIRDMEGRKIHSAKGCEPGAALDVSHLAPGTYVVRITDGNSILSGKFVKQ